MMLSEFETPFELGMTIRQVRDGHFDRPKDRKRVCVGWDGQVVRACDDNGAIDYTFLPDGRISRRAHPGYCRQIETVDGLMRSAIEAHNESIRLSLAAGK